MLRCGASRILPRIKLHKAVPQRIIGQRYLSSKDLPTSSEVVIAGGGAIGTSIAYHLTQLGWKDITLLEQGSLGCGTTWHAAGLVGSIRKSYELTKNAQYALELFGKFEEEHGVGFKQCGSLNVAQTEDRALTLKKTFDMANEWDANCRLLSPKEAQEINPLIRSDNIKLALLTPKDGVVNPTDVVQAYSKGATRNGATKIFEGIEVTKVNSEGRTVKSVQTNHGEIKCGYFINAAGMWGNELGMLSSPTVEISLQPCQHFYIVTKGMNVDPMMPVTRDHDAHLYFREWSGGLMCGGFEPHALPAFYEGIPKNFEFQLLEENWDHFGYLMEGILNRFPSVNDAEIRSFTNGPESFTPDSSPHVSFSKEFENYMIACGLNSSGIVNSAGYGRVVAELLTYGESSLWNPYLNDIRRVPPGSNNKFYRRAMGPVSLTTQYQLVHPQSTYEEVKRNIMNSPLHQVLHQHGASWLQKHNWEIPMYFKEPNQADAPPTFGKPGWLKNVQKEMKAAKESIGLIDLSSNCCFEVQASDSNMLEEFSKITNLTYSGINTPVINDKGGCVALVNTSKIDENRLLIQSSAGAHSFLLSWLHDSLHKNNLDISIRDVTGNYAVMRMMGPNTNELLNELLSPPITADDLCKDDKHQLVDVGYACDVIVSPSPLGTSNKAWDLTVPTKYSYGLFELLMNHGEKYEISNLGHMAMESLRVQQMVPANPNEVSLRSKSDVVNSLLKNTSKTDSSSENTSSLCKIQILIPKDDNWLWGGESIMKVDSSDQSTTNKIGSISSIGYSSTEDNILWALSVIQSDCNVGDDVIIHCCMDRYNGKIIEIL